MYQGCTDSFTDESENSMALHLDTVQGADVICYSVKGHLQADGRNDQSGYPDQCIHEIIFGQYIADPFGIEHQKKIKCQSDHNGQDGNQPALVGWKCDGCRDGCRSCDHRHGNRNSREIGNFDVFINLQENTFLQA